MLSVVGLSMVLSPAASMVVMYFYSVSTDSYVVNPNRFLVLFWLTRLHVVWCACAGQMTKVKNVQQVGSVQHKLLLVYLENLEQHF